jgi:hypothetical protein
MMPLILSMITSTLFLILAGTIYGTDTLSANAWVPMVFWGLLGSGVTVFILSEQAKP